MKYFALIVLGTTLAGCASVPDAPPPVWVQGPKFTSSDFQYGKRPVPPSGRDGAGPNGGRAALRYENQLGAWGQSCSVKFDGVRRTLIDAGQVIDASGNPVKAK